MKSGVSLSAGHLRLDAAKSNNRTSAAILQRPRARQQRGLHRHRYPKIHRQTNQGSDEASISNADDYTGPAVQMYRSPNHVRDAAKASLP